MFLEAGIHAREWIAPAVATFLIRELVEDYSEHPDYLDKLNWYFIPSANPDGYTYRYCTVLYCTVLYCTVLYCTVQLGERSHVEEDPLRLRLLPRLQGDN